MERDLQTTRDLVDANAAKYPDTPFLNFYDEIITYRDLDERTDAFAHYLLAKGVKKGDAVSFMMINSPYFFYTLLGAQKIGAMAVPISCWWQAPEVEFLVNECKPKVLALDPEYAHIVSAIKDKIPSVENIILNAPSKMELDYSHESLHEIVSSGSGKLVPQDPPAARNVATVMYTSGTTGKPKGVMITHRNILFASRIKTERVQVHQGERILCDWALKEHGVEAVFIFGWPRKKRPFYTYPLDARSTMSFDLLFRGLEVTTGGRRINEYSMLLENIELFGLDPSSLRDYIQIFKYGSPPHGGFAIGLERLTQKILGLGSVKEASLFPRDRRRIRP